MNKLILSILLLCTSLTAQALTGATYPCGPVGPWNMCGQTMSTPGGQIMVGGSIGGNTRIMVWSPNFGEPCHDASIGPRVAILAGSFLPPVAIPLPSYLYGNNILGIVPLWSIIANPLNASTWAVDFPSPSVLSGITLRYQYWLTWGDPTLGWQIVGSECMEVVF